MSCYRSHWLLMGMALAGALCGSGRVAAQVGKASPGTPAPLPTPAWLEETDTFCFDIHTPEEAVARGVKIICGGTNAAGAGYAGGPYVWDGKDRIYNLWDGVTVDTAKIRGKVEAAHAKGLRVIGELMRMWHPDVLHLEHPEWQELTSPDARPRGAEWLRKEPLPVTGCWNSPFGEFYIRQGVRLARELKWDGANLDGFGCWTTCYCPACRSSYREETGKDIPYRAGPITEQPGVQATSIADLNDPEYRRYILWRLHRFTRFVDRWQRAIQAENPDFASFFWSSGPGRWWHWSFAPLAECSDAANRVLNAPMLELFWDFPPDQGSNLLPSFTVRYYRGISAERPVWLLPYYCTQGQQPALAPPVECDFRLLTVLTNGGRAAQGAWQNTNSLPVGHFSKLITDRSPWTRGARSVKWAALLVSQSSRLLHGIAGRRSELKGGWIGSGVDTPDNSKLPPGERRLPAHIESAIGCFRATIEEHLPLDVIIEEDLEPGSRLDQYRVLILANAACLSDAAVSRIEAFVENGGGLVALQESSRYNELGDRRPDLGLKNLLGVSFEAVEDHTARWPNYPNPISLAFLPHEITAGDVIQNNFTRNGKAVDFIGVTAKVKAAAGTEVIAGLGRSPSDGGDPFLVLSRRGKGRTAYFAADVGQSYFSAPYQYERKLLANTMVWAAGEQGPPIVVEAPMCVQATFYQQAEGSRQIVHLLNELNTTANRALPEGDTSMREEIVPIEGIRVTFRDGGVRKATLQPEGIDLPVEKTPAGARVTVPRLGLHSMVVAELSKSKEDQ